MLLWLLTVAEVDSMEQVTLRGSLEGERPRSIKGSVSRSTRGAYMGRIETLRQKKEEIPEVKTMVSQGRLWAMDGLLARILHQMSPVRN
jgi:hypothetical protein